MSRRRVRLRGKHPLLQILLLLALALCAYRGKDYLPESFGPQASSTRADAGTAEQVLVERVVDGDTLVISGGDRVRLIGVDTPETKHPNKPPEPFGAEAAEFTRRMVEGKQVELRYDTRETTDRYGRTLAYVYVDGHFLNELLIREGLARALTNYPFDAAMKQVFRAAEASAKAQRRGIWSPAGEKADLSARPAAKRAG
jgi:micrococcal nuclease